MTGPHRGPLGLPALRGRGPGGGHRDGEAGLPGAHGLEACQAGPLVGPTRAAGTSLSGVPLSGCAILTTECPTQTKERFFRHDQAAPWSDLGNQWSRLHSVRCGAPKSRARRPTAAPLAGLAINSLQTGGAGEAALGRVIEFRTCRTTCLWTWLELAPAEHATLRERPWHGATL